MPSNDNSGRATDRVPPSYYRRYEFADGDVEALAKLAMWKPGQPNRLYTFSARDVEIHAETLTPPSQYPEESEWSTVRAFTVYDSETIVYFLETWDQDAEWGMVGALATIELHELAHLAVDEASDETGPGHWERWNETCAKAVDHVTENGWEDIDLSPAEPETGDEEMEQTTLVTDGGQKDGHTISERWRCGDCEGRLELTETDTTPASATEHYECVDCGSIGRVYHRPGTGSPELLGVTTA